MRGRRLYLLWLLLPVATLGVLRGPSSEQRQMIKDIDDGSVLAWAKHITGQDPNDLTSFDKFESVAIIPGSSNRAYGDARTDDEIWVVVQRTVDGNEVRYVEQFQPLDWGPDPNYCWFVDCAGVDVNMVEVPGVPAVPAVPATYTYTWISENGEIWGVPTRDGSVLCLDAAAVVNAGGGKVNLPYTNNPFLTGEVIRLYGTTNYDGLYTLQAGTSATQLCITHAYVAETLAGDETAIRRIDTAGGNGDMVQDSSYNLYYGYSWDGSTCLLKVAPDGTQTALAWDWPVGISSIGLALSSDEKSIYLHKHPVSTVYKYEIATGNLTWSKLITDWANQIALDASDNVYVHGKKLAAADGTITTFAGFESGPVGGLMDLGGGVALDDDLGIVVFSGTAACASGASEATKAALFNLQLYTLDGATTAKLAFGTPGVVINQYYLPNINNRQVQWYGGFLYAMAIDIGGTQATLGKIQWNGTSMSVVATVRTSAGANGFFFDLYGNLVVPDAGANTVFYYYDTDLNLLGTSAAMYQMLATWGNSGIVRGYAYPNGDLGTPEVPAVPGTTGRSSIGSQLNGRYVCVYSDGISRGTFTMDGNDIKDFNEAAFTTTIAGLNYFSILETTNLHRMSTLGRNATIKDVQGNFYQTLGAHVGYDKTYSADWRFYKKDYLMKSGSARNIGGGIVGLPYSGEPFTAGEVVYLYGSANYSGLQTLAADTNNVELRITASYVAETFDGNEWVVSNTRPDLFTGYKGPAPFLRGTNRLPKIYLWEWEPWPLTLRSLRANMEVTFE